MKFSDSSWTQMSCYLQKEGKCVWCVWYAQVHCLGNSDWCFNTDCQCVCVSCLTPLCIVNPTCLLLPVYVCVCVYASWKEVCVVKEIKGLCQSLRGTKWMITKQFRQKLQECVIKIFYWTASTNLCDTRALPQHGRKISQTFTVDTHWLI